MLYIIEVKCPEVTSSSASNNKEDAIKTLERLLAVLKDEPVKGNIVPGKVQTGEGEWPAEAWNSAKETWK